MLYPIEINLTYMLMLQVQFKTAQGVRVGLMDLIPFGLLQQLFYAAELLTHYCSPPKTDQSTCAVVQKFQPIYMLCFIYGNIGTVSSCQRASIMANRAEWIFPVRLILARHVALAGAG